MRWIVLLFAIAMPVVAWLSNSGAFGPDNGTVSDNYPTLLVAAGYAFSIWGLIFLLDLVYALWQVAGKRAKDPILRRIAPWAAGGFALTTAWMPLFSLGEAWSPAFWLCLPVIGGAAACLLHCAQMLSRDRGLIPDRWRLPWLALSLHAGWLSLAAFLNIAQVIVAFELLPTANMLGWSVVLMLLAATVLLAMNARMRGNPAYALAALWGLVAVHSKQSGWGLPGSDVAAWLAIAIAAVLLLQTPWLQRRRRPWRRRG